MNILNYLDANARDIDKRIAYTYLENGEEESESITYSELQLSSMAASKAILKFCNPGDRVIVALPDNINFISVFFACLYAGVIAVPVREAKNFRLTKKTLSIIADCDPSAIICADDFFKKLVDVDPEALVNIVHSSGESVLTISDEFTEEDQLAVRDRIALINETDLAYLQYTSGSTGFPKGVMVSHQNVVVNIGMIVEQWKYQPNDIILSWLPMFHDMGLVSTALLTVYVGCQSVLMEPSAFVQKPSRWLQAASDHKATFISGPNFAFRTVTSEYIAKSYRDLDLSSIKVAYCGSEPIAPSVINAFYRMYKGYGFSESAFTACYGMAEATLSCTTVRVEEHALLALISKDREVSVVSAYDHDFETDNAKCVVSCGSWGDGQDLKIVDTDTFEEVDGSGIGEVWLNGNHIADGYWGLPELSASVFKANMVGSEKEYLRTGDLGFLLDGNLYVTGRIKEVMIFNGENYYPQDVEESVVNCHPALDKGMSIAFSYSQGEVERLVFVQEVSRDFDQKLTSELVDEIKESISSGVYKRLNLVVRDIVLVRMNTMPRTTSGKKCRVNCKDQYLSGDLKLVERTDADVTSSLVSA